MSVGTGTGFPNWAATGGTNKVGTGNYMAMAATHYSRFDVEPFGKWSADGGRREYRQELRGRRLLR